ncbi:bifunctional lytic transglycosylase/C40 family peptidase [Streptantibioticus parmotrematis]|uniref:C40 family peptidase n=1 Tax=Streptantibioticus parmotrematis TaxID=2873249 RepID=UPI0033DCD140
MNRKLAFTGGGIVLVAVLAFTMLVVLAIAATSSVSGQSQNTTLTANTASGCGSLNPTKVPAAFASLVAASGCRCPQLSAAVLAAQLQQESGWNPNARSGAGAEGIAQFMPATWATHGIDANHDGSANVWDPADAIPSAAAYDCDLAHDVADVPGDATSNMLAAYNAGLVAVQHAGGVPLIAQTQQYVRAILAAAPGYAAAPAVSTGAAATAIQAALAEQGVPYSWGGGGPTGPTFGSCCSPGGHSGATIRGFDCSGLTQYAYAQAGITLPRTAAAQSGAGRRIPASAGISALQPGDLVFFAYDPEADSTIYHVGIYLGNGQMINAARPNTPVKIDPVAAMMPNFAGGTRLT